MDYYLVIILSYRYLIPAPPDKCEISTPYHNAGGDDCSGGASSSRGGHGEIVKRVPDCNDQNTVVGSKVQACQQESRAQ
jgi:hypothetical protein